MCYNCSDAKVLIRAVESLLKDDKQRWAIIKNKSGNLEVVPEKSLTILNEQIIYTLKDYTK